MTLIFWIVGALVWFVVGSAIVRQLDKGEPGKWDPGAVLFCVAVWPFLGAILLLCWFDVWTDRRHSRGHKKRHPIVWLARRVLPNGDIR